MNIANDPFGMYVTLALYMVLVFLALRLRLPSSLKLILVTGILLRPLGGALRWAILQFYYGGSGDASRYFGRAKTHAALLWQGRPDPFWDQLFSRTDWQGTRFVEAVTTVVVLIIGPSKVGAFMFFALFGLIGLLAFAVAFARACPGASNKRYLACILLFPSLFYWPSSVGKESLMLMGIGLATLAFVGKRERVNWMLLLFGIFIIYAVRPEVAAVMVMSLAISRWLRFEGGWTLTKSAQAVVVSVMSIVGLVFFLRVAGVESLDTEGLTTFVEESNGRSLEGGSNITAVEVSLRGMPMAVVNTTLRPFPWEAGNSLALLASLEIWAFWGILWLRRRNVARAVREWRTNVLLRISLPFIMLYSVALGMTISNLGVIARQRVFIFPFLFLVAEALPHTVRVANQAWGAVRNRRQPAIAHGRPQAIGHARQQAISHGRPGQAPA